MTSPTATAELAADPRVRAGLKAQLAERERRLDAGERSLGWKLGFGAPAARERLGIAAPLVGFLTDATLVDPDSPPRIGAWKRPLLEPEVAVRLGAVPPAGSGAAAAATAIEALAPAIELADLDAPPAEPEAILAGNVYHRGLVLGAASAAAAAELASLRGEVEHGREAPQRVDDPQAATGEIVELVRHVIDLLGAFGAAPSAGEVVICGSIVPPLEVAPGQAVRYRLEPLGELSLALAE